MFCAGLLALAAAIYVVSRETSVFAVRTIAVRGAPAPLATQVRRALEPIQGTSLLALSAADVIRRVDGLPGVVDASLNRGFPHTLTLTVRPERPVAILRRGGESWLISARGRAIAQPARGALPRLPRIWVTPKVDVSLGATLADQGALRAVAASVPLATRGFPLRVTAIDTSGGALTLRLLSGLQLRLGSTGDLRLKLAVARRIVTTLPAGPGYLDVSVPERPVAGANPQVGG